MERCQEQHGPLEHEGQEEDGLRMKMDPVDAQAAGLKQGSGVNQVENRAQFGSRLDDLTLGASSALQTQRDSPFRQKRRKCL